MNEFDYNDSEIEVWSEDESELYSSDVLDNVDDEPGATEMISEALHNTKLDSRNSAFESVTLLEIEVQLNRLVDRASELTGMGRSTSLLLLNAYKWDLGEAAAAVLEGPGNAARKMGLRGEDDFEFQRIETLTMNRELTYKEAKPELSRTRASNVSGNRKKKESGRVSPERCPICLEVLKDSVSLACGHSACRECFEQHVDVNVFGSRRVFTTKCPADHDCPLKVGESQILTLRPSRRVEFETLVAQAYVDQQPARFRACAAPDCEYILASMNPTATSTSADRSKTIGLGTAGTCRCGAQMCFDCGLPCHHLGVPCELAQQWLAAANIEHRSTVWINENTQPCPQCRAVIQRSEGCNHMHCEQCQHEFCWMCRRPWAAHSGNSYYECSLLSEEGKKVKKPSSAGKANSESMLSKKQKQRLSTHMAEFDKHSTLAMELRQHHHSSDHIEQNSEAAPIDDTARRETFMGRQAELLHQRSELALRADAHNLIAWTHALLYAATRTNARAILEELVVALDRELMTGSARLAQRTLALRDFVIDEAPWSIEGALTLRLAAPEGNSTNDGD